MDRYKSITDSKKRSNRFFDPRRDLGNDVMGLETKVPNYGSRPATPNYGKLVIRK